MVRRAGVDRMGVAQCGEISLENELKVYIVTVSEKTTWIWLRLIGADNVEGIGEATLNNRTDEVLGALPNAIAAVAQCQHGHSAKFAAARSTTSDIIGRVISSALEQAWLDREAKRRAQPVYDILGGCYRNQVPCYANINRGTLSRQPDEFADRAERAIVDGYSAVKLAPFDDVTPAPADEEARAQLLENGIERVAAVCERIGAKAGINVDCHSRLRTAEAGEILNRLAALGLSWFEEPLLETEAALSDIAALRQQAQTLSITLAGAENAAGLTQFVPFCTAGSYDVIMPDIILAGGPTEVMRIGYLAASYGQAVSLHNPCGPVMDMHSAHVAAALPELHSLERQFRETELYDDLVMRRHTFSAGGYNLISCPGLGLEIDWERPEIACVFEAAIEL